MHTVHTFPKDTIVVIICIVVKSTMIFEQKNIVDKNIKRTEPNIEPMTPLS